MNMKKKYVTLLPYIAVLAVDFYLLPFLIKDTGTAMLLLLVVMPLAAFIAAVVYGLRNGFSVLLPIAATVLFIPTIFIHYNSSAWAYAVFYMAVVLAGTGVGKLFYGKR